MRIGIVGRGWGERVVAPAFAATEGCEVVEVVSPRDDKAVTDLCRRHDVDLISVHSPPFMHLEHVERVIEAGHAVLCDKPFGRHGGDARAMYDLADRAGAAALLNFEQRFDEGRQRLRRLVLDGAIGEPEHVTWTMLLSTTRTPIRSFGWLFDDQLGGGWLRAAGSHLIDFLRWTFGDLTEAKAHVRTTVTERPDREGNLQRCTADDGFTALMKTEGGVSVVLDSSSASPANLTPTMLVVGSLGVIEVIGERIVVRTEGEVTEVFEPARGVNTVAASQHAYAATIRDLFLGGEPSADIPTFPDGLACVEVMDQLLADKPTP